MRTFMGLNVACIAYLVFKYKYQEKTFTGDTKWELSPVSFEIEQNYVIPFE